MMRKGLIIMLCLGLFTIISGCKINNSNLVGEIALNSKEGITVYLPAKNQFETILKGHFNNEVALNYDKTKILGYKSIDEKTGDYTVIFEYDIKNNEFSSVVEYDMLSDSSSEKCFKYVPNSNRISFIANDKIYVFDRDKGEKTVILDEVGDQYSWDINGEKILYADKNDKIYMYDLWKKEKQYMYEGRHPVFSNNNEYIAYMSKEHELVVYETKTKKEWRGPKLSGDERFIFSPDDRYLALAKQDYNVANNPYTIMYLIDYRSGKATQLFKGEYASQGFDWK